MAQVIEDALHAASVLSFQGMLLLKNVKSAFAFLKLNLLFFI